MVESDELQTDQIVEGMVSGITHFGAFVDLRSSSSGPPPRGLVHISQLAPFHVERVEDIVRRGDKVFARIKEIKQDGRIGLTFRGLDHRTGEPADDETRNQDSRKGFRRKQVPLSRRSQQRIDMFRRSVRDQNWSNISDRVYDFDNLLWARSPSPPAPSDDEQNSRSSNSDQSSEESRRRRRKHKSSRDKQKRGRHRRTSRKKRSNGRKRRRSYSSSSLSSSSSSSSSSSLSDSSSSSSQQSGRSKSDRERDSTPDQVHVPAVATADDSSDDEIGPSLPPGVQEPAHIEAANYGKDLLKGEGQGMAQFVQKDMRIPRRGEIGYNQDEIERLEESGYVMSGSRHARMNAVRLRKEAQVQTAEEQRAQALQNWHDRQEREAALMGDFRSMLQEKQRQREAASKK